MCVCVCVCAQLGLTLWDSVDCSLIGSSVHGMLQARILEWVAIASSRAPSQPRDWARVSYVSCTGRWTLYHWATWEATKVTGILKGILCYFVIVLVLFIYIYIYPVKFPFSIWKQYAKYVGPFVLLYLYSINTKTHRQMWYVEEKCKHAQRWLNLHLLQSCIYLMCTTWWVWR